MIGKKRSLFEETIEAPAKILESSFENSQKIAKKIPGKGINPYKRARDYWYTLGPGLTTGASDDDPSGIASYSQAGAQYGLGLLWMAAFTFPLMAVVQEMCARIGLVTGRGLAGNIRKHFGKKVLYVSTILLFAANTFNIGADIGAMAKAVQLLSPRINFSLLTIGFSILILLLQVLTPYVKYAKYLKWLALVLFVYIASAILAHPNWSSIAHHSIIPHITFSKNQILIICALLGTTITPYLFFWQTSQEIDEEIAAGETTIAERVGSSKTQIKSMRVDVWSGMFISNLVMFFIIAACGSILFSHGITNITSAAQAAQALRPFAGNATYLLFAIGIIGTGLLAIPVMAGASAYAVSESIGKRQGLNSKLKQASAFYGIIIISMLIGLGLNFIGLDPIKALIYSAVGNGIVAPVILILILLIARSENIMGEWKNGKLSSTLAWILTFLMTVSGVAVIYTLF
ncbi:MAG TPA: Nramp family divalent metal transporter [Candidatus Saccharimonadales bacterium]|jgi:NRAMP (natural resistance-associated macrophage protein)-like metal ion transporter|nr:Nramp family divalent metal transporter [Candidatus Saccharimonadales bacterium]